MAEIVILGSAQDGGVPHAGCLCASCRLARADHSRRRLPASLGIRAGDEWVMVDATGAFEEQLHMLWSRRPSSAAHATERYRPPDALILTHAHTGHYAGMWQLDRSVLAARGVRVLASPLTAGFLADQEPWAAMVHEGFIGIEPLAWDVPFAVVDDVTAVPLSVPHRSEWPTDTAALLFQGPRSRLLYMPDIDFWDQWERDIAAEVESIDIAILDGTFWTSPTSADVPHPPIVQTMDRLEAIAAAGRTRIIFTHLNHSNPALVEGGPEAAEVVGRGFEIAREGLAFEI